MTTLPDLDALRALVRDEVYAMRLAVPVPLVDVHAERAVAVAVWEGWARPADLEGLKASMFSQPLARHVYRFTRRALDKGEIVKVEDLIQRIENAGLGVDVKIRRTLDELYASTPALLGPSLRHSVEIIIGLAERRRILGELARLEARVRTGEVLTMAQAIDALRGAE